MFLCVPQENKVYGDFLLSSFLIIFFFRHMLSITIKSLATISSKLTKKMPVVFASVEKKIKWELFLSLSCLLFFFLFSHHVRNKIIKTYDSFHIKTDKENAKDSAVSLKRGARWEYPSVCPFFLTFLCLCTKYNIDIRERSVVKEDVKCSFLSLEN